MYEERYLSAEYLSLEAVGFRLDGNESRRSLPTCSQPCIHACKGRAGELMTKEADWKDVERQGPNTANQKLHCTFKSQAISNFV